MLYIRRPGRRYGYIKQRGHHQQHAHRPLPSKYLMANAICAQNAAASSGLSVRQLSQTLDSIDQRLAAAQAQRPIQPQQFSRAYNRSLGEAYLIQRRNALIGQLRRADALHDIGQWGKADIGYATMLVGNQSSVAPGGRNGLDADIVSSEHLSLSRFMQRLDAADVMDEFLGMRGTPLERDVARELWSISGGISSTNNQTAYRIAHAIHLTQNELLNRQNRAGAWIGVRDGYIVRQSHDAQKLYRAGFDRWMNDIMPRLNWQQIDAEIGQIAANRSEFLRQVFLNITVGRDFDFSPTNSNPLGIALRSADTARRLRGPYPALQQRR